MRRPFAFAAIVAVLVLGLAAAASLVLPGLGVSRVELAEVYARLDPGHPGRGITDYPGNTVEDIPKSYAMVLMAELDRRRYGVAPELPNLADVAGLWLLDNARLGTAPGWGVPVAWDAYGDGSENPANTVYSISTGIVVDALLDWAATPDAPVERIHATVADTLRAFADPAVLTPGGLVPYSLQPADQPYETYNSAAYLAGEMQRFATITDDAALAEALRAAADSTFAALVAAHRITPQNHWYWYYSASEPRSNDLAHASYIVHGLATYVSNGGRHAAGIDVAAARAHLADFTFGGQLRAWPGFETDIERPPRLYDAGMVLTLACAEPALAAFTGQVRNTLGSYRTDAGFSRYPASFEPPLIVQEYEAYLWRGLVACAVADEIAAGTALRGNVLALAPERREAVEAALATPLRTTQPVVPFVTLHAGDRTAKVAFDTVSMTSLLGFDDGTTFRFDRPGVPVALHQTGENAYLAVLREVLGGRLWLVEWTPGVAPNYQLLAREGIDYPLFRASALAGDALYVALYDNLTLTNYLRRLVRTDDGWRAEADVALPSVEDPAGGTYEMIPNLFLFPDELGVRVIAGTFDAKVERGAVIRTDRRLDCWRVIEAVSTPRGVAMLCSGRGNREGAYVIVDANSVTPLLFRSGEGIPYGLRWDTAAGRLTYRLARTPEELGAMFRFDLATGQNGGFLEFGIDNTEGRIPWSQIYYLNGLLDAVELARTDDEAARAFAPILGDLRLRLDLEVRLIDRLLAEGSGLFTNAFTYDRSPAIFAVQTSRFLLLFDRFRKAFPDAPSLASHDALARQVRTLDGHIEVLATSGEDPTWLAPGLHHLRWPKGSAFYFDGLAVPFNHQNEWAYALFETVDPAAPDAEDHFVPGREIVTHFLKTLAPGGGLPALEEWDYWWGHAYDGYDESSGFSVHMPAYGGDHILAWISFRTIDLMSVLAALPFLDGIDRDAILADAARLVGTGGVYPFAARALVERGYPLALSPGIAHVYARAGAPWELSNAPWAIAVAAAPQ